MNPESIGFDEGRESAAPDLGPCCCCEKAQDGTVRNLVHMEFEAPPGFAGWGCLVCRAPNRGAMAVICDDCAGPHLETPFKFICGGQYMADKIRVPFEGYEQKPFGHNLDLHREAR